MGRTNRGQQSFYYSEAGMTNIRTLLTRHRIVWKDHGANCSPGNINVSCPLCGDDPSYHLAISEEGHGFYCLRNPRHSGKSYLFIFKRLGVPITKQLIDEFGGDKIEMSAPLTEVEKKSFSEFKFFQPAENSQEALNYLSGRHFLYPVEVCRRFSLKISPDGRWAGRLIIPLTVGWTGRSMRPHIHPRYLSETDEAGLFLSGDASSIIIVEGPLDALRAATVSNQYEVGAQLGGRISPALLMYLKSRGFLAVFYLPDSTVPFHQHEPNRRLLASYCTKSQVVKISLPSGYKDVAEMTEDEARKWLLSLESQYLRTGPGLGQAGPTSTAQRIFGGCRKG